METSNSSHSQTNSDCKANVELCSSPDLLIFTSDIAYICRYTDFIEETLLKYVPFYLPTSPLNSLPWQTSVCCIGPTRTAQTLSIFSNDSFLLSQDLRIGSLILASVHKEQWSIKTWVSNPGVLLNNQMRKSYCYTKRPNIVQMKRIKKHLQH